MRRGGGVGPQGGVRGGGAGYGMMPRNAGMQPYYQGGNNQQQQYYQMPMNMGPGNIGGGAGGRRRGGGIQQKMRQNALTANLTRR